MSVSGTIDLIQANVEKVVIEAHENLQEDIEVLNSGRKLYVTAGVKWRTSGFNKLNVQVYYRQLYNIYNGCVSGRLICANTLKASEPVEIRICSDKSRSKLNINAPAIKLITASVGDVEIEGACNVLEIKARSEGNLFARKMEAKNVVLKNYSQGDLELFADEILTISNY